MESAEEVVKDPIQAEATAETDTVDAEVKPVSDASHDDPTNEKTEEVIEKDPKENEVVDMEAVEEKKENDSSDSAPTFESKSEKDNQTDEKPVEQKNTDAAKPNLSIDINSVERENDKPPLPRLLVPSLRGTMTYEGGIVICKGNWGMSDEAHNHPDQLSPFEFKLLKADEDGEGALSSFPINGIYQGYFLMKTPPKGSVKVEDRKIHISFTSTENGSHSLAGDGENKFGKFKLHGTLDEDGNIQIYRAYYNLTPVVAGSTPSLKRKNSVDGTPSSKRGKASSSKIVKQQVPNGSTPSTSMTPSSSSVENVSPRGSGRERKKSTAMQQYELATQMKTQKTQSSEIKTPEVAPPEIPQLQRVASSDRSYRIKNEMKKCLEILKGLERSPQGIWFLEPVDHVKYNLPDYPKIIKYPMDFSTIRANVESGRIDQIMTFVENVRLVFRNAVTFNHLADSQVHKDAKDLGAKFEEKMRALYTQFNLVHPNAFAAPPKKQPVAKAAKLVSTTPKAASQPKKPKVSQARHSIGAYPQHQAKVMAAPRASSSFIPTAIDTSSHKLMEMQRMMQSMQNEINSLRSAVRENEIMKKAEEMKAAAHNPLTFNEKRTLIEQIHKLPAIKMNQVLEIIQSSKNYSNPSGDEIEIPLDELDTYTLRRLQSFIEENTEKKKRPPSKSSEGGNRRKSSKAVVQGLADTSTLAENENVELLFEAGTLEANTQEGSFELDFQENNNA